MKTHFKDKNMNIILIGNYSDTLRYSSMLSKAYDLIKIDSDLVLSQNNIIVGKSGMQSLFETVFHTLMLEHMQVMSFHQLKTGFVFIKYPKHKSQISSIERKFNTKMDLIIDLSDGKMINDLDESDVPLLTIDNSKSSEEIGNEIRKSIVRRFMKKSVGL